MRYSPERKESVLRKITPPSNRSISQLPQKEEISVGTLYNWRSEARSKGILMADGRQRLCWFCKKNRDAHDGLRDRMISIPHRYKTVTLIEKARQSEVCLEKVCAEVGIASRTCH